MRAVIPQPTPLSPLSACAAAGLSPAASTAEGHHMPMPPSTGRPMPVMNREAPEARNTAASPCSTPRRAGPAASDR